MESQHRYQPKGLNKLQPGRTLGNVPEPRETGQVGHTWGCTLLECLGRDHSVPAQHRAAVAVPGCCPQPCSAPAQHHLPPVWDQPAAVQAPQESNSSSNSAHVPPYSKAVRQTRPAPPTHPRQPEPLPFQVLQQEEEGDEVGVRQRAEKVHHAVLLGSRIREGWKQGGRGLRAGSGAAAGPTMARYLLAASV